MNGSFTLMEMEILHTYIKKTSNISNICQKTTYFDNILRPLNGKLSVNSNLPMVLRVGHYYFDNKPLIGKIVDFHAWTR